MLRQTGLGGAYALLQARQWHGRDRRVTLLETAGGEPRLTSVIRLPSKAATFIVETVLGIPGADQQYVYPVSDVHLTVLNLDRLAGAAFRERIEDVQAVLGETASFEVELRGFGMSSRSIYARAFDATGALQELRERLARITEGRPPLALRYLGFVNVVRFLSPEVERLRHGVHAAGRIRFGAVQVTTVEIVQTDKVLSRSGTVVLGSVRLAEPR